MSAARLCRDAMGGQRKSAGLVVWLVDGWLRACARHGELRQFAGYRAILPEARGVHRSARMIAIRLYLGGLRRRRKFVAARAGLVVGLVGGRLCAFARHDVLWQFANYHAVFTEARG